MEASNFFYRSDDDGVIDRKMFFPLSIFHRSDSYDWSTLHFVRWRLYCTWIVCWFHPVWLWVAISSSVPEYTYLGIIMHMYIGLSISVWICISIRVRYVYVHVYTWIGVCNIIKRENEQAVSANSKDNKKERGFLDGNERIIFFKCQ